MPSLRELFEQHDPEEIVSPSKFATWAYNLLEAIVEELEAQRPPQVDARIVALTADRDSWERQCRNAERGLAEAKETVERLRKESNLEMAARMMGKPLSPELEARFEELKADARIGELVRGMRPWSRLARGWGADTFWVDMVPSPLTQRLISGSDWRRIPGLYLTPATALRAIQKEVGDGKADILGRRSVHRHTPGPASIPVGIGRVDVKEQMK